MPEEQVLETPTTDSAETQSVAIDVARPATRHHAAVKPATEKPDSGPIKPPLAAPVAATEPEPSPAAPVVEPVKPPETPEKPPARDPRIDELYRTRAENERYKAELAALKAQPLPAQPPTPAAATPPAGKPTWDPDAYATKGGYEQYVEDLTDWKAEQKAEKVNAKLAKLEEKFDATEKAAAKQKDDAVRTDWQNKIATAGISDYDTVVKNAPRSFNSPSAQVTIGAILQDSNGPQLVYHLSSHPEEVERIDGLPPLKQLQELAKLSATFDTPRETAPKPPVQPAIPTGASKAPPPVVPLRPEAATPKPDPKKIASENGADVRDFAAASGMTLQRSRFANRG